MNKIEYISPSNLETYTKIVKAKLDERIQEPTEDGAENMVLRTNGNGTRYWSEIEEAQACTREDIEEILSSN